MIDAPTCQIVQRILRDESRTLLLYACESFPLFTASDKAEVARLQHCADQELAAARAAAVWLARQGKQLLPMDPYPTWYPRSVLSLPFATTGERASRCDRATYLCRREAEQFSGPGAGGGHAGPKAKNPRSAHQGRHHRTSKHRSLTCCPLWSTRMLTSTRTALVRTAARLSTGPALPASKPS